MVPALVIALISLAYLEEDGLLLSIALLAAVIVPLTVELMVVWETVLGAMIERLCRLLLFILAPKIDMKRSM